jgi:hypothetical protein
VEEKLYAAWEVIDETDTDNGGVDGETITAKRKRKNNHWDIGVEPWIMHIAITRG